jgi:hypothetical protein
MEYGMVVTAGRLAFTDHVGRSSRAILRTFCGRRHLKLAQKTCQRASM